MGSRVASWLWECIPPLESIFIGYSLVTFIPSSSQNKFNCFKSSSKALILNGDDYYLKITAIFVVAADERLYYTGAG